jgi:hypothetical protein
LNYEAVDSYFDGCAHERDGINARCSEKQQKRAEE